jgi:hypothetical protein
MQQRRRLTSVITNMLRRWGKPTTRRVFLLLAILFIVGLPNLAAPVKADHYYIRIDTIPHPGWEYLPPDATDMCNHPGGQFPYETMHVGWIVVKNGPANATGRYILSAGGIVRGTEQFPLTTAGFLGFFHGISSVSAFSLAPHSRITVTSELWDTRLGPLDPRRPGSARKLMSQKLVFDCTDGAIISSADTYYAH